MYLNFLEEGTLKTFAISRSFLSIFSSPISIFVYMIGSTIRKLMNVDRYAVLIQTSVNMINDATGVAFIIEITGDRKSRKNVLLFDNKANTTPKMFARMKPKNIFVNELNIEFQKDESAPS